MALPRALRGVRLRKTVLFMVGLLPLVMLAVSLVFNPPADPYERIAGFTGENTLRLLVLTLLVTPLTVMFNWRWLGPYRRTLGVLCFTYAFCHFFAYQALEADFEISYYLEDVAERRYILAGTFAFLMMVPLALTSNNWSVGRLGGKAWKRLHQLVFPLSFLGVLHMYLQTRGDKTEPLVYLALLVVLCAFRLALCWHRQRKAAAAVAG